MRRKSDAVIADIEKKSAPAPARASPRAERAAYGVACRRPEGPISFKSRSKIAHSIILMSLAAREL